MPTLTEIPDRLIAGDSYALSLTEDAYPASAGWALRLVLNGPSTLTENSVPSGDAHALSIAATESALLVPGTYQYIVRALKGAEVTTVRAGILEVTPDVATAGAGTLATWAEQMLAAVEAALLGVASDEMKLFMIDGRQLQKMSTDELMRARVSLRAEVAAQRGSFGVPVVMTATGFTS